MYDIACIGASLARARQDSRLTQGQLATRVGTSQSAIANLERGHGNPTLTTLDRCARALGCRLHVELRPGIRYDRVVDAYKKDVDRTLLRENLRKSYDERIQSLEDWQGDLGELAEATRRAKAQHK